MNARARFPLRLAACLALLAAGDAVADGGQTLQSLEGKTVQLPPDTPIPDAGRLAEENYRKFVELSGTDPKLAAEALRRLGDLGLESSEANALQRGNGQLQADTYAKSMQLYRELLQRYPSFAQNDEVLYQMARAQESGGDPLGALATLDTLVARYPHAPMIEEAQFRRGEILFSHQRYGEAEQAYAAVLKLDADPAHPGEFRSQALYKHGWSLFKQDRYDTALSSFFKLLDERFGQTPTTEVDKQLDGLSRPVRELVDDTLRVMSLSLSYMDGVKTLQQVLAVRGQPQYGHLLYLSLSSLYMEQKRYADAAGVLTGFVDAQPLHPRAPYLYMQAVGCLEQGKFPTEVLAAREGFVKRFGLDQAFWKTHAAADYAPAVAYLRESVWMLAQHDHALAQVKNAKPDDRSKNYGLAAQWYRRYLAYFPQDAQAPKAQFLLGEVLFQLGDDAAAVQAYEAAAYDYPQAHNAEAGYAALLAYQRHEKTLSGKAQSDWHRRGLDAQLHFATVFPDDARAVTVRMSAADGLFNVGALPQAIAAATPVTTAAKATPAQRRSAWLIIGQAQFNAQQYAQAEAAFLQVRSLDQAAGKRDAELSERIAASIYRQGEQARAGGHPAEAAAAFLRVGQVVPDSRIRVTADYDAAKALLDAGQTAQAIPVLESFRRQHPDSSLSDSVTANLALAYLKTGDTTSAAREFERIADNPHNDAAERKQALLQAAQLYQKRKDAAAEAHALTVFVQRYPDDFNATVEAQQRLIELAAQRHDESAQLALCRKLIAYDAAAGKKRTPRSRELAARATLALAEPARRAFLALPLKAPLKVSLKRKKALMQQALNIYGKATDYGVASVLTESTFHIGEIYNGLAKALYASERPKGMDADTREQYDMLLQEQAFPFEEKAIQLHEANVQRAREGIYDEWVKRSYASLAQLLPARYARPDRGEPYVAAIR
jgi:tetratricopeptide (TPR) repeat protein